MSSGSTNDAREHGDGERFLETPLPIDLGPGKPRRTPRSGQGRRERSQNATGDSARRALTPGDLLELRIANLWFAEGAFTRSGVALRFADAGETKDITDVDLFAIRFDGALRADLTIGEAKSGTGKNAPKPIDRSMWLRGLASLTGASHAELTMAGPVSSRERRLAADLRVNLQTLADVARREEGSGLGDIEDLGPHCVALAELRAEARRSTGTDPDLVRIYQYLRGDVWFADPWAAAKRLLATIRLLGSRIIPEVGDLDQRGIRWMMGEAIVAFSLVVARLTGQALHSDSRHLREEISSRLLEGMAPVREMRQLSESVDQYLTVVLNRYHVPRSEIVAALGAFAPTEPPWTEAFAELLVRTARDLSGAAQLPRYADLAVSETFLRSRRIDQGTLESLGMGETAPSALRSVLAFLEGQAGLPRHVVDALTL